jgi:hypothetical protein
MGMDSLHSGVGGSARSWVSWALGLALVTATTYAAALWAASELVHLEPYSVELTLVVPRVDVPRLVRALRLLQPIVGAALIVTILVRRARSRRPGS